MIKISIITVTLNSQETIRDTLNSVLSQNYKNIEHIIIDGGSNDQTLNIIKRYPNKNKKLYIYKKSGIYQAINYGIKKCSGDYIAILNSDDFYHSNNTINNVVNQINKNKEVKIFTGNVVYFKNSQYYDVIRYYNIANFKVSQMKYGLMPPHPATFIKKEVYQQNNLYNEDFLIASDFEFFLRILYIKKTKFKKLNQTIIRMRVGGISTKNFMSYIISTKEIFISFKLNKIKSNIINILVRLPLKLHQYFYLKKENINKDMQIFKTHFDKNYSNNNFNILGSFKKIPFKKNFILSAMNLAFLGYYAANKVYPYDNLYHWTDGISAEKFTHQKKQPGRDLIKKLLIPDSIKNILIIGNISKKSEAYLVKHFKKKIIHKKMPYANIESLKKIKIKLPKNTLTFITLPTPKQEQIAFSIAKYNKEYKIICIGASISIASNEEKVVPKLFIKFEFLWRLKTDTFRRILRLTETLYYYLKGRFIQKKFLNTSFKKID